VHTQFLTHTQNIYFCLQASE